MKKILMQAFIVFSLLLTIPVNTSLTHENVGETIYEPEPTSNKPLKGDELC